MPRFRRLRLGRALFALVLLGMPCAANAENITVPLGLVGGMTRSGTPNGQTLLRVVVDLKPKADLDALARTIADPASPLHHSPLGRDAFVARFGRGERDVETVRRFFQASGGADVYTSRNRLVVGGVLSIAQIEHAFKTRFARFVSGNRVALAPVRPLELPVTGVRAVRGVVAVTTPRLADVPSFTIFRGDWYNPDRFRTAYDAIVDGGRGMHVALVEDASDRAETADFDAFSTGAGAPRGIAAENVDERPYAFKSPSSACGRDDRGQEPTLDVDAVLTLAPRAAIDLDYDDVCSLGNDGTIALTRALDATRLPDVVVFPFTVADEIGTLSADYGPPPVTLLEAAVLGVPVVAAAGDDGAFGMRLPGQTTAAVTYPCVSPFVICAGGTQLGDRNTSIDEAIWNDGTNAGGGGVSNDPRPSWQTATGGFEFSTSFAQANHRLVPDVSADASGHLRIFWHDYEEGGIGGTSESAALVGAELAAINAAVLPERRLTAPGDLYALAHSTPAAFRDVARENDRGYRTNTLHLPAQSLPLGYKGFIPTPPPLANGCVGIQQDGCQARPGYDAVSGIGSLLETPAITALK